MTLPMHEAVHTKLQTIQIELKELIGEKSSEELFKKLFSMDKRELLVLQTIIGYIMSSSMNYST